MRNMQTAGKVSLTLKIMGAVLLPVILPTLLLLLR